MVDGAGLDPGLSEDRLHRLRDDLADAFVPNPAFLPGVVEGFPRAAEVIDEIGRFRNPSQEGEHALPLLHQQRRGAIAIGELPGGGRFGLPLIRAHHQRLAAVGARNGLQGLEECRGARTLGAGDV